MPTTFAAGIDNNPIYATRAEQDRNGDQIDLTYAKKTEVPAQLSAASGLVIESNIVGAKVDGTTITVNQDGELEAIGGGGSSYTAGGGIDISNDVISAKVDGNTITVNSSGELVANSTGGSNIYVGEPLKESNDYDSIDISLNPNQFTTINYGVIRPLTCISQGTLFSYIYNPWKYSRTSQGKKTILVYSQGVNSSSSNRIPFWFPIAVNDTSAATAPRLRVLSNGYSSLTSGYKIYRPNGTTYNIPYIGNYTFSLLFAVPPGPGPNFNFDTTLFAVEGDWSTITTPVEAWYLGIATSTDGTSWYGSDGLTNNANTTERAIRIGDNGLSIMFSDSSLSANGAGIRVTHPLPASTVSDEGKILAVDSSGNPYWATLSDLGIVTNS